jgi:hypothetical protein
VTVLRATLAALGGYYLSATVVLVALTPLRYSLPHFGDLYYDPAVTILAVITAVGVFVAAVIAYSRNGTRAFVIVAILAAIVAASVLLPFIAAGPAAWTLPSDLHGITTAGALALSLVPAVPALLFGGLVGARFSLRGTHVAGLEAAGAYYLTSLAMLLPTPQLDYRLTTLPFTAAYLPDIWHAAAIVIPAIAAGLVLAMDRPLRETALLGGAIGLAAAAPGEVGPLLGLLGAYWPVSLAVVPIVTAAIFVMAVIGRRAVAARKWPVPASRPAAAALGAAVALLAVGAWSVLATMPNSSDRLGPVQSYTRTGDERKIVACVVSGRGEELLGSSAREEHDMVAVAVRLRQPPSWYFNDLVGISLPVVITLRDPLGSRTVVDERSGATVPEMIRTERTGFAIGC